MKPTTGKHWVSLAAKTHNPSSTVAGLDASDNILGPIEGAAELFFLTSPFIGPTYCFEKCYGELLGNKFSG